MHKNYKTELQSNNTDLQSLIDKANALPDYVDTSDATATPADVLNGKTIYINGKKVAGLFNIDSELSTQDSLISQIKTALDKKRQQ